MSQFVEWFPGVTLEQVRTALERDAVTTAYECGWRRLKNGELLETAEQPGFEVLVTTDSNLKYQQNIKSRRIAIVVLSTPSWPRIQRAVAVVVDAVDAASEGSYAEVEIP